MTTTEPTWPHPTAIEVAIYDGVVEALKSCPDVIERAVADAMPRVDLILAAITAGITAAMPTPDEILRAIAGRSPMILPTTADTFALVAYKLGDEGAELTIDRVLAVSVPVEADDDAELHQLYYLEHDGWAGVERVRCTGPHAHVVAQGRQLLGMTGLVFVADDPETFA